MDNAVPYRINGNPHLLLKLACWMGEVDAGWELEIANIKYEIIHRFNDCLAIKECKGVKYDMQNNENRIMHNKPIE